MHGAVRDNVRNRVKFFQLNSARAPLAGEGHVPDRQASSLDKNPGFFTPSFTMKPLSRTTVWGGCPDCLKSDFLSLFADAAASIPFRGGICARAKLRGPNRPN